MNNADLDIVALGQRLLSNSLTAPHPIHRLPVELLERILISSTTQPSSTGINRSNSPLIRSPNWIAITHVCRLWRQITLHCPHLWTHITPNLSSAWITTFASRSKSVPLIVEINVNHIANGTLQKHLSANSSRLRELYLGYYYNDENVYEMKHNLAETLSTPAPLLENLVLDLAYVKLGDDLFGRYIPKLRRLWLGTGMSVPPTSSLLPNLHYLKMCTVTSLEEMLMVLQQTPVLEILHIGHFTGRPVFQMLGPTGSITRLPHLSHLFINPNSYTTAIRLFESLEIPPTAHLWISLKSHKDRGQRSADRFRMFDLLAGRLRLYADETSTTLTQLRLYIAHDSWAFEGRTSSGTASHLLTSQHLLEEIDDTWSMRKHDHDCRSPFFFTDESEDNQTSFPMDHIQAMCDHMPLASIRVLHLCLVVPSTTADVSNMCKVQGRDPCTWLPILRLVPEVRVLKVSQDAATGVLRALTSDVNVSLEAPLFVHLTALIIEETYIGCPDRSGNDQPGRYILQGLKILASKRKKAGLELESILFRNCQCIEGIVDLLGGYVRNVSWVGRKVS